MNVGVSKIKIIIANANFAPFCFVAPVVNIVNAVTSDKGTVPYGFHADVIQRGAITKGIIDNARHASRQRNRGKGRAIRKGGTANSLHAGGDIYCGKVAAMGKTAIRDLSHAGRKFCACQAGAVDEGEVSNTRYSIR